jgi:hypothetical protein
MGFGRLDIWVYNAMKGELAALAVDCEVRS